MKTVVHWLPAAAVAVLIGAGVAAVPALAGAGSDLPAATVQEVLELAAASEGTAFSGTVEQTSDLGLPELPAGGPRASSDDPAALVELLTADHRLRVFSDGASSQRMQILDRLAERDLIRNGSEVWVYDSQRNEATHIALPEHDSALPPGGAPPTPPEVAQRLLAELDASTEVTVARGARVAGRDVYELELTPRIDGTLVGDVTIAVDGVTGLPLRVSVDPRGSETDAFTIGFTSVDFATPDADLFRFTPPAGARVAEGGSSAERGLPDVMPAPVVSGSDWRAVIELPADLLLSADPEQQALITQLTTAVPEGRVLQTRILTVLLTDDGRVLAGAVPLEALRAAVR